MKTYAGIGARSLKPEQQPIVTKVATYLAHKGYTVHSGAADGVDQWFSDAATQAGGKAVLHVPWAKHSLEYREALAENPLVETRILQADRPHRDVEAFASVEQYHPAPNKLSWGARCLHARNYRILVPDAPVQFVVAYPSAWGGGTMQGVRVAESLGIPVVRLDELKPKEVRVELDRLVLQHASSSSVDETA